MVKTENGYGFGYLFVMEIRCGNVWDLPLTMTISMPNWLPDLNPKTIHAFILVR